LPPEGSLFDGRMFGQKSGQFVDPVELAEVDEGGHVPEAETIFFLIRSTLLNFLFQSVMRRTNKLECSSLASLSRQSHDSQHNDIQHKDIQHNDIQHKGLFCDTQHIWQ
jgi:hypothetical protein